MNQVNIKLKFFIYVIIWLYEISFIISLLFLPNFVDEIKIILIIITIYEYFVPKIPNVQLEFLI